MGSRVPFDSVEVKNSHRYNLSGYRPIFTCCDIMLNRNTSDIDDIETYRKRVTRLTVNFDRSRTTVKTAIWNEGQTVPMIFVCTTLWHENEAEMTTLLTSLIRLIKTIVLKINLFKEILKKFISRAS